VRQVLQDRRGSTAVREVPLPPCQDGDVLVRNRYSVISSGTDRARVGSARRSLVVRAGERPDLVRDVLERTFRDGLRATRESVQRELARESAVGYSSAGVVLEVGRAVTGLEPGDLVACGGVGHANHADVVSVPRNLCARAPDGVSALEASFATIAAVALHGIRLAEVGLADRVAVVGCGLIGQIACRLLRAAGAETFALDVDPARVEQACAGGADHGILAADGAEREIRGLAAGAGVDRALVTAAAPSSEPLRLAAELLRDRGTLVLVGDVPVELPRSVLYERELVLRVSRSYGPGRYDRAYEERGLDYPIGYVRWTERRNMEAVLDLVARGRLELADLAEVVPVAEAARAYERLVGPPEERPRGALVLAYNGPANGRAAGVAPPLSPAPAEAGSASVARAGGALRIGLVGPGSFAARTIVPAFAAAGARLEVVGGGSGPSAEAAVRTGGFARAAESAEAVLADPSVDAVAICTRHGLHAALAAAVLAAGKHVFCEKPLALDREELEAVVAAAERSRGVLAVGFNRRFSPLLAEAHAFLGAEPGRLVATYRVSAGRLPGDHWVHDLEQGGGRAIGEVCHFVDTLAFLAGSPVAEVYAAGHGAPGAPLAARDNLAVTLRFGAGDVATILYSAEGASRVGKERLEAFRGDRTAILDDYRSLELVEGRRRRRSGRRSQDKGHAAEIAAFVAACASGVPPVPLGEVANVSLAAIAIVESLQRGEPVRL
jgi:predicted dehydrogenase